MIEAQIVFKKDSQRNIHKDYRDFINQLIAVSGDEEIAIRKRNSGVWKEHESENYYQVVGYFKVKELKKIEESKIKNYRLYVYGDKNYGKPRLKAYSV